MVAVSTSSLASAASPAPGDRHDDVGRRAAAVDLLGLLAYAQIVAFERLAEDSRIAPQLADKAALGRLAVAEFSRFERVAEYVARLGCTVEVAMRPFVGAFDEYQAKTAPADWLESLVKTYVGDGIARDFYREMARALDPDAYQLVTEVLSDTGHAEFAVARVRGAIATDPTVAGRLALWARRLVGEAITQAQHVASERPALVAVLFAGRSDDGAHRPDPGAVFAPLLDAHRARMAALGLAA